ncbi:MAG: PAS domain-containing protein [bacterium]|nr:PAS domain-containing protein [bacterium]
MTLFANLLTWINLLLHIIALVTCYGVINQRLRAGRYQRIIQGVLFGLFGIMSMLNPIMESSGVMFDFRNVIIVVCILQSGLVSGVIAAAIVAAFRIALGGVGLPLGLSVIGLTLAAGAAWYAVLWQGKGGQWTQFAQRPAGFATLGLLVALISVAMMQFLPSPQRETALQGIAPLLLIAFPLMTTIMLLLLCQQRRSLEQEEALAQERNLLRTLIDAVPDYIFVKDANLRFILSNTAHARAAHLASADALIGKKAADFWPPELAAHYDSDDRRVLAGETLIGQERASLNEDASPIYVTTTKVPMRDGRGRVTGVIGISRDVTAQKLREQHERELLAERQRADILRTFIESASHDFRTPLSIISTNSYLLHRDQPAEQRALRLATIEQQVQRVTMLLDEVVEMVRLDMNTITLNISKLDVRHIVEQTANGMQGEAGEHGQTLLVEVPDHPLFIFGDAARLTTALKQVIANAIQHSPAGETVTIKAAPLADHIEITVEDHGEGIDERDREHVFERLYRGDKARSSANGGSGLGLPIAKRIIEAHDGSITFESHVCGGTPAHGEPQPDCGTTFYLYLPAADRDETVPDRRDLVTLDDLRSHEGSAR